MADEVTTPVSTTTTPVPVTTPVPNVTPASPATSATPIAPTTATTAQVAAHHNLLQTILTTLEALPTNAANAVKYLDTKAQVAATWVQAKHVKTRLLEVSAIVFVVAFVLGFLVGRFL